MPACSKCHPTFDLGRICPHQCPGLALWEQGRTAGRAEVAAVLLDLIAELRAQHYADQCECGCEQWYECEPCSHISLCPTQEAAIRAEARLREVEEA